jgi:hypothetical protein
LENPVPLRRPPRLGWVPQTTPLPRRPAVAPLPAGRRFAGSEARAHATKCRDRRIRRPANRRECRRLRPLPKQVAIRRRARGSRSLDAHAGRSLPVTA